MARHGLRLLQLLDDNPVVPGDVRPAYTHSSQARQILNDAEDDLRDWRIDGLLLPGEDAKSVDDRRSQVPASQGQGQGKGKQKEVDTGSVVATDSGSGGGNSSTKSPLGAMEY